MHEHTGARWYWRYYSGRLIHYRSYDPTEMFFGYATWHHSMKILYTIFSRCILLLYTREKTVRRDGNWMLSLVSRLPPELPIPSIHLNRHPFFSLIVCVYIYFSCRRLFDKFENKSFTFFVSSRNSINSSAFDEWTFYFYFLYLDMLRLVVYT